MSSREPIRATVATVLAALARIFGRTPEAATPDAICELASAVRWTRVADWESVEDTDLARSTGLFSIPFVGAVVVVTEYCFTSGFGGFLVAAAGLEQLVQTHLDVYGECFFNGDVAIVEADGSRVWMFHHEGAVALIE